VKIVENPSRFENLNPIKGLGNFHLFAKKRLTPRGEMG
jgi:hypothetical protein